MCFTARGSWLVQGFSSLLFPRFIQSSILDATQEGMAHHQRHFSLPSVQSLSSSTVNPTNSTCFDRRIHVPVLLLFRDLLFLFGLDFDFRPPHEHSKIVYLQKPFRDGRTTRQRCDIQQTIKSTMLSGCFQIQQRANLLHWKGRLEVCSKKMEIEKRHVKPYHPRIKPIARKSMRKHDARKAFCSSQVTSTSSKCSRPSLLRNGLGLSRRADVQSSVGFGEYIYTLKNWTNPCCMFLVKLRHCLRPRQRDQGSKNS